MIEQAKKTVGHVPDLLDTEALIWLNRNQPQTALKLLEVVVAEAPSGPVYFHLAQAELAAKNTQKAKRAWKRARELAIRIADLHPLERKSFEFFSKAHDLN